MPNNKSNLSETAKFVKKVMDEVIMPEMEKRGIAMEANKIILNKPKKDSPEAVEFTIHLKEMEEACMKKLSDKDPEKKKKETVGRNYCRKLRATVEASEK